MKKIYFIFILQLILFDIFSHSIFAQVITDESNGSKIITYNIKNENSKIVSSYDVLNYPTGVLFNAKIIFIDKAGDTLKPITISGDLTNITPGSNKKIYWDVLKDEDNIPEIKYAIIILTKASVKLPVVINKDTTKNNIKTVSNTTVQNNKPTNNQIQANNKTQTNNQTKKSSAIVTFNSNISNSSLYIDSQFKNYTPYTWVSDNKRHKFEIEKDHFLPNRFYRNFCKTKDVNKNLFPAKTIQLNLVMSNREYWGAELGISIKHIFVSAGLTGTKKYRFSDSISYKNANVDDLSSYSSIGKKSLGDTTGKAIFLKIGLLILKPIRMIIHIGVAGIQTDNYIKVYNAKHNYYDASGNLCIKEGQNFSGPYTYHDGYTPLIFGVAVPFFRKLYFSADYWTNSETGHKFIFGVGFLFRSNLIHKK